MDRPKIREDEDDLLKFQTEFLANKSAPSAAVVRKGDKRRPDETPRDVVHMDTLPASAPSLDPQPPKKSRFRGARDMKAGKPKQAAEAADQPLGSMVSPDMDPEELMDKQDRGLATVLTSIIERDTRNAAFTMPGSSTHAFPSVVKNNTLAKEAGQRKSLFAQQIARQGLQDFGVMVQQETSKMDVSEAASFQAGQTQVDVVSAASQSASSRPHIIDGRGLSASSAEQEAQSIHTENLTKMAEMSQEDILAEQQQLLKMLDPGLVAFLKSKSQSSKSADADQPKPKASQKKKRQAPQIKMEDGGDLPEGVPAERKKWVNMEKVEYDKLEWMKDLPPPSTDDTKTGQQARFDFQGNVIHENADIPVSQGLHHHGEEPQRAGYSISELFQLSRSTNIQQRVLALNTLGNIMQKAKEGTLDDLIQTPILPSIVEGGVIFLLRWACDDSVDAVMAAAVSALCALLCNPADEAALDVVSPWYQGTVVPALIPLATTQLMEEERMEQDEENKAQETDADVTKRDLIQGLVSRMMLLDRLFYILDGRRPQAPTVVSVLHILTRVARHSSQMAYEIARNTRLMELIFSQFLPTSWKSQGDERTVSSVYGRPLAAAMRLVGSLCQAGRHISSTLLSSFSLGKVLLRYLAVTAVELDLPAAEADGLQQEGYRTWRVLLTYGLAGDVYMEMYEPLVRQVQAVVTGVSDLSRGQPAKKDSHLLAVLEAVVPLAAIPPAKASFKQGEIGVSRAAVVSAASWSCVESMSGLVRICAESCLNHLAESYTQQKGDLQFTTACLNFLATYHSKWEGQPRENAVDFLQQVERLSATILQPFLKSWGFTSIVADLSASSNILTGSEDKRREVCGCLPELGCDSRDSRVPIAGAGSSAGFMLALVRLVYTLCKVNKGVLLQTAQVMMNHEDVLSYLGKVTSCPPGPLHSNHFTRFENLLHYHLIKLAALAPPPKEYLPRMHQLALDLMGRLQEGDAFLAHDLMSTVLFNAEYFLEGREEELTAASMADMKISETHFLKSATQEEITTNNSHLLRESCRNLNMIRTHYFKAFSHMEKQVEQSRCRHQHVPQDVSSQQTGQVDAYLMPRDWVFLPLVELYNLSGLVESKSQSAVAAYSVAMVTGVVQWIFLLETWRSRALASVAVTLKISRVMCVFMAGNDLFLERSVYPYLASLFRCYTTPRLLAKMDFDEHVPGISAFYDLYQLFLDQYEAVSFGDPVFASFVLLPMQQSQSMMLRRAVWQERSNLLRTLTIPVKEMLIDLERFLTPHETDTQLLQLYGTSLVSGAVRQCWSPVLFLLALHHLNAFLYFTADHRDNADARDVRDRLWDMVLHCRDQSLKEMMVEFKQVNPQAKSGMDLYSPLPPNRAAILGQHRTRLGL